MAGSPPAKGSHPRLRRRQGADGPTTKERDYLEVIYYLAQRAEPMIAAHVGRWLLLQPPTVSHALQEMERKGLITRNDRSEIALTPLGVELAEGIVRRHRLLEHFLADVADVPWHLLHEEAVQLEHALSPLLEQRIAAMAAGATVCPHGNPIPGSGASYAGSTRLDHVPVGVLFTIRRVEEEAEENTDLLRYLEGNRLLPGNQFFVTDASPAYGVTLRSCSRDTTLSPEVAAFLWGDVASIATVAPEV